MIQIYHIMEVVMLKNLTYSCFKAIRLVISLIVLTLYVILLVFPDLDLSRTIIYCSIIFFISIYLLLTIFIMYTRKSSKYKYFIEDELTRENDGRAAEFTIACYGLAIITLSLVANSILGINLEFSSELALSAYMALVALNDGLYLYFEWSGMKDAGTDDDN